MPHTIHFNTGRLYTADGQRITATFHDDGAVTFYDHSRGIEGEMADPIHVNPSEAWLLWAYDRGKYNSTQRSRNDDFSGTGCNAVWVK